MALLRYVTSVVNGCDAIPMMSSVSADVLREEVMASEWYDEFHRDMRQYKIFRAFESTKRWMSTKQSTMPSVTIRACGLEQGELVARLWGLVDRVTTRLTSRTGLGSTRGDVDRTNQDTNEPRREAAEDGNDGEDAGSPFTRRSRDTASESLEAEASWRRKAVQEAVLDAEATEREEHQRFSDDEGLHGQRHGQGREGREDEPHVPSIIRPGNYGGQSDEWRNNPFSSPSSSSRREGLWKRSMYPAGRIMHFVPAHVVPGFVMIPALSIFDSGSSSRQCLVHLSHAPPIHSSRYENSVIEDEEPFVESPLDDADSANDGVGADRSGGPSESPIAVHARHASELGFEEIMGGEGEVLHVRTVSDSGPLPALKAAPGPPPKNMVLVDNVPQRLYGRMRYVSIASSPLPPPHSSPYRSFVVRHGPGHRQPFCPIT